MVTKQDVAILFGGGATTAVIDGLIEMFPASNPQKWSGKFPYVPTIEPLPPVDDWIVLAIPAVTAAVGHLAKKDKVRTFGLGGLLYAVPMFIHHIIIRAVWATGIKFQRQLQLYPKELPIPPIKEI